MTRNLANPKMGESPVAKGFVDRHCHPLFAAREMAALSLSHCNSLQDIQHSLTQHLAHYPEIQWLDATPFDRSISEEFAASVLDEVSADIPITLHSTDHHALWVNTAALKKAGLLESVPKLSDGIIQTDASGAPSGLLLEWSAMKLVLDHQPQPSLEADLKHLAVAQKLLTESGVVAFSDAWIDPGLGEVYVEASKRGILQMPAELWVRVSPDDADVQLAYLHHLLTLQTRDDARKLVRVAGIKIFLDGVLSAKSAAVLDAYSDGSFGTKVWADAELDELLSKLADISPELRPHFHAIGDAAVRQALDSVSRFRSRNLWTGLRRPVVAHAELIATPDVLRFKELDVEVVISPQWLKSEDTDNHNFAHMSADVVSRVGDFAPLIETGAVVTYGSDWPVSLPDPELAISAGVSHLEKRGYSRERATEALHKICTADY